MPIDLRIQIFRIYYSHDDLNMEKKQEFQEGTIFFHYSIFIGQIKQEEGILHCTYLAVELSQQKTESAQYP